MADAILFDWDGTLWDALSFVLETYTEVFKKVGVKPWSRQMFRERFTHDWEKAVDEMGLGDHKQVLVAHWEKRIGEMHPQAFEWAGDILVKAGEVAKVGVVSSAPKKPLHRELKRNRLWELLDLVLAKEDVADIKPSPKPLKLACELLGADTSQSVYIGDMEEDIMSAKSARLNSVAVTWGIHSREKLLSQKPDFLADNPYQIIQYIKKL